MRPLRDERLMLKTFLCVRLDEDSRIVRDLHRAFLKKLTHKPVQAKLALIG